MPQVSASATMIDRLSSRPDGWRRAEWRGGVFETASRPMTKSVEGKIRSQNHLVMATLSGGAERHQTVTDCGHRYDGPDRPSSISFLPAGCERRLKLSNVGWRWAAIGLDPAALPSAPLDRLRPFSASEDTFILAMLNEFDRLDAIDGGLDATYCETMGLALAQHLLRRDGESKPVAAVKLPPWRLRRIGAFVDANIDQPIRIADLARLTELSDGHFHRAFRATTGTTPLEFIQRRRIDVAKELLVRERGSIVHLALRTGFVSPAHFARVFRSVTGQTPSAWRRTFRSES